MELHDKIISSACETKLADFVMFVSECTIIDITPGIKENTISLRQSFALKLPDCIIAATSLWLNMPLITADSDFKNVDTIDLIYFER